MIAKHEWEKFRQDAMGFSHGDEDFAQFACLYRLERGTYDLRKIQVEYYRKLFGRTGAHRPPDGVYNIDVGGIACRRRDERTFMDGVYIGTSDSVEREYENFYIFYRNHFRKPDFVRNAVKQDKTKAPRQRQAELHRKLNQEAREWQRARKNAQAKEP